MRVLLDTHILLWALAEPGKLPKKFRTVIEHPESEILFSAASVWEFAIKAGLGRLPAGVAPKDVAQAAAESGFIELPVRAGAAALVAELPPHHRDPFDRLLLAQAMEEPAAFCTVDKALGPYSGLVNFV